jgi:N-acyl-D-amino-acid deacylase
VLDLAIRGGTACVGRECRLERADVGIADGRIVAVGAVGSAREEIDATDRIVAPGFIDIHTHSDFTLPIRPAAEAKLRQGVTTDVSGNCGFSPFPSNGGGETYGSFFEPDLAERWTGVAEFSRALEGEGVGINVAPLVGLGTIRVAAIGETAAPASADEIDAMCRLLAGALDDGAFGASSGLVYSPGSHADAAELVALARVVGRYGALYATHMRNESHDLREAIVEALETSAAAGCALQISHLKVFGRANWGATAEALALLDEARGRGQDVDCDVYPYTAGSTSLAVLLPPAVLADGERALKEMLADPQRRVELADAVANNPNNALEDVLLAELPSRPDLAGRRLDEAARDEGCTPADLVLALIEADGRDAVMIVSGLSEADVRSVLLHPRAIVGSDGWVMTTSAKPYTHPRSFSFTARLLAHYVRDERVLTLEDAVRKLTVAPAERLGIADRGVLAPDMAADVVVLDLDGMSEMGTFADPCVYPVGFDHVVVNGELAITGSELTGRRAGRVLRRG